MAWVWRFRCETSSNNTSKTSQLRRREGALGAASSHRQTWERSLENGRQENVYLGSPSGHDYYHPLC